MSPRRAPRLGIRPPVRSTASGHWIFMLCRDPEIRTDDSLGVRCPSQRPPSNNRRYGSRRLIACQRSGRKSSIGDGREGVPSEEPHGPRARSIAAYPHRLKPSSVTPARDPWEKPARPALPRGRDILQGALANIPQPCEGDRSKAIFRSGLRRAWWRTVGMIPGAAGRIHGLWKYKFGVIGCRDGQGIHRNFNCQSCRRKAQPRCYGCWLAAAGSGLVGE